MNSKAKDNVVSAWNLDDNNSETISEDDLLEADDLKKPAADSLKGELFCYIFSYSKIHLKSPEYIYNK